jgi:hypothetical protein
VLVRQQRRSQVVARSSFLTTPSQSVQVVESPHDYHNNMDTTTSVHLPGSSKLTITFDRRSRTEHNCDWLQFKAGGVPVGPRLSGVTFPGMADCDAVPFAFPVHTSGVCVRSPSVFHLHPFPFSPAPPRAPLSSGSGAPPLVIPGDSCDVVFHSDGSTTFWGARTRGFFSAPAPKPVLYATSGPSLTSLLFGCGRVPDHHHRDPGTPVHS